MFFLCVFFQSNAQVNTIQDNASLKISQSTDTIHILFLGNSFTQRHNLPDIVRTMVEDGKPNIKFIFTTVGYGGRSMKDHWELGSQNFIRQASLSIQEQQEMISFLEAEIAKDPDENNSFTLYYKRALPRHKDLLTYISSGTPVNWDIVVLQSWQDDMNGSSSLYMEYAARFAELVAAQGGKPVIYETTPGTMNRYPLTSPPGSSARNSVLQKAESIANLARQIGAYVVPMSMVALRSQTDRPDFTLRYIEDFHPNQTMAYLTACTFYAALFNESPLGLPLDRVKDTNPLAPNQRDLDKDGGPIEKIFSEIDRADLQRIAWDGIADFKQFTTGIKEVKGNLQMEIFPNPSNGLIKLKFGDNNIPSKAFNIKLMSIDGKEVYSRSFSISGAGETSVDISPVPPSLYLLRVEIAENFAVAKIMISN
jgi:hypothetical protein